MPVPFPLHFALLVLVLLVINWMTFTGEWWVQWVALALAIVWAITVYRFTFVRFMRSKGAWWMKWTVLGLVIAWAISFVRVLGTVMRGGF